MKKCYAVTIEATDGYLGDFEMTEYVMAEDSEEAKDNVIHNYLKSNALIRRITRVTEIT